MPLTHEKRKETGAGVKMEAIHRKMALSLTSGNPYQKYSTKNGKNSTKNVPLPVPTK
jgi:hypothetical protein